MTGRCSAAAVVISHLSCGDARLKNLLYLHGFASSPQGRKVTALKELLDSEFRFLAPDLNAPSFEKLDFKTIARVASWEIRKHRPAVIVGSSLGALVALEAARTLAEVPMVLIAPAVGLGRRWVESLPAGDPLLFFHHGEGRQLPIHRRFFQEMARVDADREPPGVPVTVIMGAFDESVPFETVRKVWERWEQSARLAPGSRFVEIPGGDHGLVEHVEQIAQEIRSAAASEKNW